MERSSTSSFADLMTEVTARALSQAIFEHVDRRTLGFSESGLYIVEPICGTTWEGVMDALHEDWPAALSLR